MHPQGPQPGWGAPYAPPPPPPPRNNAGVAILIIGLAVVVVVAVGAGAFFLLRSGSSKEPATLRPPAASSTPTADDPTAQAPAAQGSDAGPIAGTWQGTYTCPQGDTGLRLTIRSVTEQGDLTAIFAFSAVASNPTVPSGSFAMRGTLKDGKLNLIGDHWISRPGDYEMVSLQAAISDPRGGHFTGTIDSTSCRTFSVRRVS